MKYDTRNTRLIYNMEELKGIREMKKKKKQKTVSNRKESKIAGLIQTI